MPHQVNASGQSRARSLLHLEFYAALGKTRAEAEEMAEALRYQVAREVSPEQQFLLRASAAGAQSIVDLIDDAIGKSKRPPTLIQVVKTLREQAEARSRGTAVASLLVALHHLEGNKTTFPDLPQSLLDAVRDAAIPFFTEGALWRADELPSVADLDAKIAKLIVRAGTRRKLEGKLSAAVAIVAKLRGKDQRTVWRAWKELKPPSI